MFSLLITIISIALVVALAIAVIYYGGEASKHASTRAVVDTLINQAAQINAAGTVSTAQGPGWPNGSPQFAQPYLTAMPVPPKSAYLPGTLPQVADWEYYVSNNTAHHFVLRDKIRKDVCLAVNKQVGVEGIPAAWDGKSLIQCFGTGQNVAGAYTFFYDPVSSTAEQNAIALDQSLAEGGTNTPGYPRWCADNTTIFSGVCPAGASSGNSGTPSDGNGTPADGGNSYYDGNAPDQWECDENPGMKECLPDEYPALKIENIGGYPVRFTAVKDCSYQNTDGNFCLPVFHSINRTWNWGMPDSTWRSTNLQKTDGRLGWLYTDEMGFVVSDGEHSYTISKRHTYGSTYTYEDITSYPRTPSVKRPGTLAVSCAVMQQDIESKGGYFLPSKCDRFETGAQYSWIGIFSNAGSFAGANVLDANIGWTTNWQNWGYIDTADIDSTHQAFHYSAGIDTTSFIIGAYPTEIDERVDLHIGNEGGWPVAPLSTDMSGGGF